MTEPITIGVDHGYAAMKTAHCSFPSGLAEYEHEPYTQKNVLCYDGKYYVVGSGRQPLQKDKTADENYYLLTLTAIAKEIAYRNAPTTTPVILAAGLPLTSFGREKKAFRAYLLRESKPVSFSYEGISYETSVQDVKLFPQGYAAILQHSDLLNEPSVILADIGGWTVDIMRLDNRIPNAASCRSLELGMIRCLDEIAEQVRRSLNLSLTSAQIENVLRGSPDSNLRPLFLILIITSFKYFFLKCRRHSDKEIAVTADPNNQIFVVFRMNHGVLQLFSAYTVDLQLNTAAGKKAFYQRQRIVLVFFLEIF